MVACKGHSAMRATLDAIVAKFKFPSIARPAEPTYTLELTGPGIFTDAIKTNGQAGRPLDPPRNRRRVNHHRRSSSSSGRGDEASQPSLPPQVAALPGAGGNPRRGDSDSPIAGEGEAPLLHISRLAGHRYFRHVGQGSWKTYRFLTGEGSSLKMSKPGKASLDPHEVCYNLFVECRAPRA